MWRPGFQTVLTADDGPKQAGTRSFLPRHPERPEGHTDPLGGEEALSPVRGEHLVA